MTKLKTLFDNKCREGEMTPCEKILGDLSRVYRIADFWDTNADLMELIASNELLEFATEQRFDSDQFATFRLGLNRIGAFMSECAKERRQIEDLKISGKPFKRSSNSL